MVRSYIIRIIQVSSATMQKLPGKPGYVCTEVGNAVRLFTNTLYEQQEVSLHYLRLDQLSLYVKLLKYVVVEFNTS